MENAIAASTGGPGTWTTPRRSERERDRVRKREGGDRPHKHPRIAHDQEQREHEQAGGRTRPECARSPCAINAPAIASGPPGDDGISSHGCDGSDQRRGHGAVCEPHAYEHVGDRALQTRKLDAASGKAARSLDQTALDQRIRQLLRVRRARRRAYRREASTPPVNAFPRARVFATAGRSARARSA